MRSKDKGRQEVRRREEEVRKENKRGEIKKSEGENEWASMRDRGSVCVVCGERFYRSYYFWGDGSDLHSLWTVNERYPSAGGLYETLQRQHYADCLTALSFSYDSTNLQRKRKCEILLVIGQRIQVWCVDKLIILILTSTAAASISMTKVQYGVLHKQLYQQRDMSNVRCTNKTKS